MIAVAWMICVFPGLNSLRAGENEDYQTAVRQNTLDGWEIYLKQNPVGEHSKAAREAHDVLLGKEVEKSIGNSSILEKLFKRSKNPASSDKIFKLWDEAFWEEAKKANTQETFHRYLLRFPGGSHVKEANVALDEAAWRGAQASGKMDLYQAYVADFPNGAHVVEARKAASDLSFEAVKAKDTIEAYEVFLSQNYEHKAAQQRLQQLLYERAVNTGTLQAWKSFADRYPSLTWTGESKEVVQMKENARREVERLLYEKITADPTLESCRDYLQRFGNGVHKPQVMVKMEACLYDQAIRVNDFQTYLQYLQNYPEGFRDQEIRSRLDAMVFKPLDEKEDFYTFEEYLRFSPKTKEALLSRMEPLMFEWAKKVNTIESFNRYGARYPTGAHRAEIQAALEPLLYQKAQEEDWYTAYEKYLKDCPDGKNVGKVKERLAFLKANKAVVEVDYPKTLEQKPKSASNDLTPLWEWKTTFKETSGKMGFKVRGTGEIMDLQGHLWGIQSMGSPYTSQIYRDEIKVPAGGSGKDSYWCSSSDHNLCNGDAIFTWTGEDAGGHSISINVKVHLQHTGCPGPKEVFKPVQ